MKTLIAALIAGLFGLTSMYAVASPLTGKATLSQRRREEGRLGREEVRLTVGFLGIMNGRFGAFSANGGFGPRFVLQRRQARTVGSRIQSASCAAQASLAVHR